MGIVECVINNKEWIFSGLGVFIIGLVFFKKRKSSIKMKQKVSKDSFGVQATGDIKVNTKKDE